MLIRESSPDSAQSHPALAPFARLVQRRPGTGSGASIWIFLALGRLSAKTAVSGCWISLDFLGFSRPNRDISMGYAGFSLKNFSLALFPSAVFTLRRGPNFGFAKGQTCSWARAYPIFCFSGTNCRPAVCFRRSRLESRGRLPYRRSVFSGTRSNRSMERAVTSQTPPISNWLASSCGSVVSNSRFHPSAS
jgi:hypothetical protein